MSNKLSTIVSLAYRGTDAVNPPNWSIQKRNPTSADTRNVVLGDLWLNKITQEAWCLVSLEGDIASHGNLVASWIKISNTGLMVSMTGNDGIPVPPSVGGNINVIGDGISLSVIGDPISYTLIMSLLGSPGSQLTLTGDTGGPVSSGIGNNVFLVGGSAIDVVGNPGTNTLTVGSSLSMATSFDTDAGSAVPAASVLEIAGGSNINTSGATDTVTVDLDTTITGITDLTVNNLTVTTNADFSYLTEGVLQSDGMGNITSSKGTDGQLLIGSTSGAPTWANITAGSNISIVNGANSITINKSASGGNGWEFIETKNSYQGNFLNIPNTYKTLVLVIHKQFFTNADTTRVIIQISDNNGSSYYNSNYISGVTARFYQSGVAPYPITSTTTSAFAIGYIDASFGLYHNSSSTTFLYNVNDSTSPKLMSSMFVSSVFAAAYPSFGYGKGAYTGSLSGPIDAIRVSLSTPPPTVGPSQQCMTLYGLTS